MNAGLKPVITNGFRHIDKSRWDVENGRRQDDIRREIVLILVRSEAADIPLAARLKNSAPRLIGLMEDEIAPGVDQRQRRQPRCAYVIRECTEGEPALLAVNTEHRARCIRFDCVGDEAARTHPERTGEGIIAAD